MADAIYSCCTSGAALLEHVETCWNVVQEAWALSAETINTQIREPCWYIKTYKKLGDFGQGLFCWDSYSSTMVVRIWDRLGFIAYQSIARRLSKLWGLDSGGLMVDIPKRVLPLGLTLNNQH